MNADERRWWGELFEGAAPWRGKPRRDFQRQALEELSLPNLVLQGSNTIAREKQHEKNSYRAVSV
jgi:hypothetical protein